MQKTITKTLILAFVLTAALGVNYLFAAWTGPTQAPTGGNTSTPVHVGTTDQVKNGGLSLDALSVFGSGYFQGNVGVGVVLPTEALEVNGGVKVGNSTNTNAGTIRWTGSDFEGYNGTQWVSLVSGEAVAVVDLNYTECTDAGGDWMAGQSVCYFAGSSCPSGWGSLSNFSSAVSGGCPCIGGYTRQNQTSATCSYGGSPGYMETIYWTDDGGNQSRQQWNPGTSPTSCSSTQAEIGCTKN